MTKLVFMGTPAFSATVLEGLLTDERYDISCCGDATRPCCRP